jgi:cytochrome P450
VTTELAEQANAALAAYARLEAVLPSVLPTDLFVITRGLVGAPAALAAEAETVGHYLATVGFVEFELAVLHCGKGIGLSLSPGRARRLATRKRAPRRLTELPSFAKVALAFSTPMGQSADFPADIAALVTRLGAWNTRSLATWSRLEDTLVHQRVAGIGTVIADAIRLHHDLRTKRIDDWLATAPEASARAFEGWRDAFDIRGDALGCISAEALLTSDLLMPERGTLRSMLHNIRQLGDLIGGEDYIFGTLGMFVGLVRVMVKERRFFARLAGRQLRLRGWSFSRQIQAHRARRLNAVAGRHLIGARHSEELRAAYAAMQERGVTGRRADALAVRALEYGHDASGKPWKGLVRLTQLIVHSGVDPGAPEFESLFHDAIQAPVDYTHVPGKEWIVREYELGRKLMQIDGKIMPGETVAAFQQGRGSLAPGYVRAGAARTEFGRRYSKPLGTFLDSMVVADGADHQRLRRPFLPFFSQQAVLNQAEFVERTTAELFDEVEALARRNGGAFDFRKDFAYRFPIEIICRLLELPAEDVPRVQHWTETSVRAMDIDAGFSVDAANAGQRATDELREYLQGKLNDARSGAFPGMMIRAIANDETLSEAERISNLAVILFAGFETTTGLLSKGLQALLEHPEQWALLQSVLVRGPEVEVGGVRVPDRDLRWLAWSEGRPEREVDQERAARLKWLVQQSPALRDRLDATRAQEQSLDAAIEEMLRWTAPGTVVPLTASRHVQIELPHAMVIKGRSYAAGESLTIESGETIGVAVDELNRRCPFGAGTFDTNAKGGFDVSRTDNTAHLSFGLKHACIGAFLAKENAKRAMEGVLRRFPDLALDGDPVPQDMELFSGLASLPVRSHGRRLEADAHRGSP